MKIAACPVNPTVGDPDGNAERCLEQIRAVVPDAPDVVLLPELVVCGYPPRDLLLRDGFLEACRSAGDRIGRVAGEVLPNAALVIGLPVAVRRARGIANRLEVWVGGERRCEYDKRLLPTYDVFDEDRYFAPGDRAVVFEHAGEVFGLSLCEDLWRAEEAGYASRYAGLPDPIEELAKAGATVVLNPSASPFVIGKTRLHEQQVRDAASRHGVAVVSVNQAGANDELIFDSAVYAVDPSAKVTARGRLFEGVPVVFDASERTGADDADHGEIATVCDALTVGVRDYARKTGFRSAVLGLSGGIDSAVTAAIAVRALGSGDAVLGLAMPSAYSSDHSVADAHDLADRLGIECVEVPIAPMVDATNASVDDAFGRLGVEAIGATAGDVTEQNIQSRIRGTVVMGVSNRTGRLALTTGNKSELAVGYCTLYGDMNGGLAVLADLVKGRVFALARYLNEHHAALGFGRPPIPERTITKPPSAELAPGQLDADSLPPYDLLDEIVVRLVERRETIEAAVAGTGADAETVARVARLIRINEYKRWQLAIGLKVTPVAFGTGRRAPVAQRWSG